MTPDQTRRWQLDRAITQAEHEYHEGRLQDKLDALREYLTTEEIVTVIPTIDDVMARPEFAFLKEVVAR